MTHNKGLKTKALSNNSSFEKIIEQSGRGIIII